MTTTTTPEWARDLIDLLDRQKRVYEELRELSERQSRFVEEGQAEPLLILLGQRQRLINELTRLNGSLEPMRRDWPARAAELDDASRSQINTLVDQVQGLLRHIMQQDDRDRAALAAQRDAVGGRLGTVRAGAAVNRAYAQPAKPDGLNRYTDERG